MKKNYLLIITGFIALLTFLNGCTIIGGIFKAGVWVGVVGIVIIILIILWLISKASKK